MHKSRVAWVSLPALRTLRRALSIVFVTSSTSGRIWTKFAAFQNWTEPILSGRWSLALLSNYRVMFPAFPLGDTEAQRARLQCKSVCKRVNLLRRCAGHIRHSQDDEPASLCTQWRTHGLRSARTRPMMPHGASPRLLSLESSAPILCAPANCLCVASETSRARECVPRGTESEWFW